MEGKVNYTVVGLFVIVLAAFLLTAIIWLTTEGHGKTYKTYLVYVHEDVTGLSAESPVRFNGVKVGYLQSIQLDNNNPKLVKLELRIERDVVITTSTYAILNAQGITGVVYVNLKAETESAPALVALPGQPYPIILSRPSLLMQLSAVLPEVTKDIQALSASIAQVLDKENRTSIRDSLKNIQTVTKTLADNSADFTASMQSLRNTLFRVSQVSDQMPETINQLNKTLSSVDQLSLQMGKTSLTINQTMQSGRLVIHNFSDQLMPAAQQALSNLSTATTSVHQLSEELQRDPSMLVRGRAPQPLGPGEK